MTNNAYNSIYGWKIASYIDPINGLNCDWFTDHFLSYLIKLDIIISAIFAEDMKYVA